ncbi:MAG: hypothetical protein JRG97_11735 [Deltaproteobacteria bacterium]|nr:hypothetical protein [Deltaproteobacteria bacterium]MBW2050878.1 hypothetical protein [Deltaproteobacteria bacterium]MBW2141720.1 hypothetical protein [Deltaproteobacteria bacterium]MBW2322877.1 hypothetical protein [Deltaproteobacteria bacterium]
MRILAMLLILVSTGAMDVVNTARVTVRYDGDERRLAKSLTKRAEKILTRLEERVGLTHTGRINIVLASSRDSFLKAQQGGTWLPDWAAGVAYPQLGLIILKSPKAAPGQDLNHILVHEMAHLVLGQIFKQRQIPTWLNEALTMHLAGEWGFSKQVAMTRAVISKRFIHLDQLALDFPRDRIGAETAYAESYYFIAFLRDRFGLSACRRLIRNLSFGVSLDNALLQATGQRGDVLEDEFFKWLRIRFSLFPILTSSGVIWFLATLAMVVAWVKKRRQASRQMAVWELEEDEKKEDTGYL